LDEDGNTDATGPLRFLRILWADVAGAVLWPGLPGHQQIVIHVVDPETYLSRPGPAPSAAA
jgi:hypothetical protein